MYQLLDGKHVSEEIRKSLCTNLKIKMAIVLIGDDIPSQIYVNNKIKTAESMGISVNLHKYNDIHENDLLLLIDDLNNSDVNGIIVQLPLPRHINAQRILKHINPIKDIDGLHPYNYGQLILNDSLDKMLIPATPFGIYLLLEHYKIQTCGKKCTIIGRGLTVGTPLNILLSKNIQYGNMTVTLCHSKTNNLQEHTLSADILISATGISHLINENMVKKNAIVIDVGITRVKDDKKKCGTKLVGDVDYENVKNKCSYITPVPGGVGPMTIIALLSNLHKAYKIQHQLTNY